MKIIRTLNCMKMVVENYEDFSDSSKKEFAEKCEKRFSQSSPGS